MNHENESIDAFFRQRAREFVLEVEKELLSNKKYEKYFSFIPNWVNDGFNKKNSKVNREFNRFNNRYK